MIPAFGVGLRNFLFEQKEGGVRTSITSKIQDQVSRYMPFIKIQNVIFKDIEEEELALSVKIEYFIPAISVGDTLEVQVGGETITD